MGELDGCWEISCTTDYRGAGLLTAGHIVKEIDTLHNRQ